MNIEICKRCEKLKNKNCSIMLYEDNNEFTPIIFDNDSYFHEWICQMKTVDSKNITLFNINGNQTPHVEYERVEVYNDCPYYLEHQLSDWNKK